MSRTSRYGVGFPFFNRILSALILIIFITTNHFAWPSYASPASPAGRPAEPSRETKPFPADLSTISLPEEMGKIEEIYWPDRSLPPVILIQDAHAIPDAQRNIQKIIDYFRKQYGVGLVALEGASSDLDPQIFRSFPDKEILKKTLQEYFERGELTGSAASAILNENDSTYRGIEDWNLYEQGISFYLAAMKNSPALLEKLSLLEKDLQAEKEATYSKELLEVDRAFQDFRENHTDLIKALKVFAETKRPEKGTELAILLEESEREEANQAPVEIEVKNIAKKIEDYLTAQPPSEKITKTLRPFHEQFQAFQTSRISPQAFALFLKELTAEDSLPIKISGQLSHLMKNQKRMKDIEGTRFFRDFEQYVTSVKDKLFRNEEERRLDQAARRLEILGRLICLELSREEWKELKTQSAERIEQSVKDPRYALSAMLSAHYAFYENAEAREEAMFGNLMKMMNGSEPRSANQAPRKGRLVGESDFLGTRSSALGAVSRGTRHAGRGSPSASILVAGGFHTEGLTERLKEKNISYLLLMPQIGSIPEDSYYLEHMRGNVSWKDYFKVENGKINFYKAFVRGTRDRLIGVGANPRVRPDFDSKDGQTQGSAPTLLKSWRDQIIRDLAAKDKITTAGSYTAFIDEVDEKSQSVDSSITERLQKIDKFIEGLRRLETQGQLTHQNLMKLLKPSAILEIVTANALVPDAVSGIMADGAERSEVRAGQQSAVSRQPLAESGELIAESSNPRSEVRAGEIIIDDSKIELPKGLRGQASIANILPLISIRPGAIARAYLATGDSVNPIAVDENFPALEVDFNKSGLILVTSRGAQVQVEPLPMTETRKKILGSISDSNQTFGARLKLLREQLQISGNQFALNAGLDSSRLSRAERDQRYPSLKTFQKIINYLLKEYQGVLTPLEILQALSSSRLKESKSSRSEARAGFRSELLLLAMSAGLFGLSVGLLKENTLLTRQQKVVTQTLAPELENRLIIWLEEHFEELNPALYIKFLKIGSEPSKYLYFKSKELGKLKKSLPAYPIQGSKVNQFSNLVEGVRSVRDQEGPYQMLQFTKQPIYFIHFGSNEIQGLAFDRLGLNEVKRGYVPPDEEFRKFSLKIRLTGGGGHNYRVEDLADFFNAAEVNGVGLNAMEVRMREEFIAAGLLATKNGKYLVAKKDAAVISITRRGTIADFNHEFNHGIYFTDPKYRRAAFWLWNTLKKEDKIFIANVLRGGFPYNFANDEDLLIREFIAYFRDPKELLDSYLKPWGPDVLSSEEGDSLFALKSLYLEDGTLRQEVIKKIEGLSKLVFSIDQESTIYRQLAPPSDFPDTKGKTLPRSEVRKLKEVEEVFQRQTGDANQSAQSSGLENPVVRYRKNGADARFLENDMGAVFSNNPSGVHEGLHGVSAGNIGGKLAHEGAQDSLGGNTDYAAGSVTLAFAPRAGVHDDKDATNGGTHVTSRLGHSLSLTHAPGKSGTLGHKSASVIGINKDVPFHAGNDSRPDLESQGAHPAPARSARSEARTGKVRSSKLDVGREATEILRTSPFELPTGAEGAPRSEVRANDRAVNRVPRTATKPNRMESKKSLSALGSRPSAQESSRSEVRAIAGDDAPYEAMVSIVRILSRNEKNAADEKVRKDYTYLQTTVRQQRTLNLDRVVPLIKNYAGGQHEETMRIATDYNKWVKARSEVRSLEDSKDEIQALLKIFDLRLSFFSLNNGDRFEEQRDHLQTPEDVAAFVEPIIKRLKEILAEEHLQPKARTHINRTIRLLSEAITGVSSPNIEVLKDRVAGLLGAIASNVSGFYTFPPSDQFEEQRDHLQTEEGVAKFVESAIKEIERILNEGMLFAKNFRSVKRLKERLEETIRRSETRVIETLALAVTEPNKSETVTETVSEEVFIYVEFKGVDALREALKEIVMSHQQQISEGKAEVLAGTYDLISRLLTPEATTTKLQQGTVTLAINFSKVQDRESFFEELFKAVSATGQSAEIFLAKSHRWLSQRPSQKMEKFNLRKLRPQEVKGGVQVLTNDQQEAIPMALDQETDLNEIFMGLLLDSQSMSQDANTQYANEVLFAGFLIKTAMILSDPVHKEAIRSKINDARTGDKAVDAAEIKKIKADYLKGALIQALEELGYQNVKEAISRGNFGILTLQGKLIADAIAEYQAHSEVRKAA